ncbi:PEP-CTERM sorting domain-containing protein [Limnofasciculus baicalensis]|uniref:PEP-CTERM sorting domain-containing protein n=1 Tax=Limnofasciculus baicalensis BBK-W-15 TaxID=2699891 RepID=A0AAE3GTS0_9CYAN|nr:PEP-CTERM sorting domain-containing protein [Limnofasciculus baicalensis]MCP2730194.1 PEP-CTERM sorting domain-containing protein [Limnofasciculus baicalensis BBK-W-15]
MFTSTFVKKLSISAVGAACLSLGAAGSAQAITLSPGGWNDFIFGDVGEVANPGTFDFTVPKQGGILKVTDAYSVGDVFDIFNLGTLLGGTSFVEQGESITGDPDKAYADSHYSSGRFVLAEGNYSISIKPSVSPAQIGKAYIRWDEAIIPTEPPTDNGVASVPEPSSVLSLLALGAIGIVSNLKRKLQIKAE